MKDGRPCVHLVAVDDSGGSPALVLAVEVTSSDTDTATQLLDLARSLGTRLQGLAPVGRAVVRRADKGRTPRDTDGPKVRLMAEGAAAVALRQRVPTVDVGPGVQVGHWHGTDKATADAEGTALVTAAGNGRVFGPAAAAALAALALGP